MKEKASHLCYAALRLLDERLLDQVTLTDTEFPLRCTSSLQIKSY